MLSEGTGHFRQEELGNAKLRVSPLERSPFNFIPLSLLAKCRL